MSDKTTTWYLKLKDMATGPLKKLVDMASGTQKQVDKITSGLNKLSKASNSMGRDFKRNIDQLNTTLANLEKRQAQAFHTKHIQAYQRMIEKTRSELSKMEAAMQPKRSLKQRFGDAMDEIPMLGNVRRMASNPAVLAGAGMLAFGVMAKKSVDIAADFDYGLAKINATAQLSDENLGKLKGRLKDIGSQSGGNFEKVPEAYEKILSQTGKVNLSLDILETSVKGAKAGFADLDLVAGSLAQTMSAIGEGKASAEQVLDTFMKGKALGGAEFEHFATYMPGLIASGNNLSMSFKDVTGLFSYMTAKGNSAADSAMLIQNAFTALQKNEVMKGLGKKGIPLFNVDGSRRNIKTVFLELSNKLSKMTDKGKTNFLLDIGLNDAQARSAFSVLTSDANKFNEIMSGVNDSLGEANKQLAATDNYKRTWGDIGDELKSMGESLGAFLLPIIDKLVSGIHGFARDLKGLFTGDLFKKMDFWKWQHNRETTLANGGPLTRDIMNSKELAIDNRRIAMNSSIEKAAKLTKSKFGEDAFKDASRSDVKKYYTDLQAGIFQNILDAQAGTGNNKNNIVDEKGKPIKKATDALKDINGGSSSGNSKSSKSEGSASGDGNKIRNLTMNLTVNTILKGEDSDVKNKQQITDIVVAAARDAMVQIGV